MATLELTEGNFEDVIEKHPMVVIDFWAPWCGPCRVFGPIFEHVAELHPDIAFAKVNTEEQLALAQQFEIRSIPTLMVVRDRLIIFSQAGALQKKGLEEVVRQTAEIDMAAVRQEIAEEKAKGS